MRAKLKLLKPEISDDVLCSLAIELEREGEARLQELCRAVLSDDHETAKKLAKELSHDETSSGVDPGFNRRAGGR